MSGEVFHAPLLTAHPGFRLTHITERRRRRSAARYPDAQIVTDFNDLLADESVQLVVVNTPNTLHLAQTKAALLAGKHVIVEKPFTNTVPEAQELIALANRQNRLLSVFQNRRWDGDFRTVQQVVRQNLLGKLVEFEAHYDRFRNYVEQNTWKEETGPGSGILYNLGSHMIDQALVLFGVPQAVAADIRVQRPGGKIDDSYDIRLHYPDMRVILKSSYLVRESGPRYVLHGTDGSFVKYGLDPQEDALKAGRLPNEKGWGAEDPPYYGLLNTQLNGLHYTGRIETLPGAYLHFYDNIHQAITQGAPLAVQPQESMQGIQVIEAAMESSRMGKRVSL